MDGAQSPRAIVAKDSQEKEKLPRMAPSNSVTNAVSVYSTYRKPFDMIVERAKG
jgi:hypothetical protein